MRMLRARRRGNRRGTASIEFAIACPVMLLLLCGLADFGLALWDKSMLANAVAQGAYYAYLTGTNVSNATIQTMVQQVSKLSGVNTSNTVGPACYCITGSPLAPVAATCTSTCGDSTTPGTYVQIIANYSYTSIFPGVYVLDHDSSLINPTLTERTWVRLK